MKFKPKFAIDLVKAILLARVEKNAPGLAACFEILALVGALRARRKGQRQRIRQRHSSDSGSGSAAQVETDVGEALAASASDVSDGGGFDSGALGDLRRGSSDALQFIRGFATAALVARGVGLLGRLVLRPHHQGDQTVENKADVRALQIGLTHVPYVDPAVPRTLEQYARLYHDWLLLLRVKLTQEDIDLPPELEQEDGGVALIRFGLTFGLQRTQTVKDALLVMDKTIERVRAYAAWRSSFHFLCEEALEVWSDIAWWEGPDKEGYMWMMIDAHNALTTVRGQGADAVSRILISQVHRGVHELMPRALGCGQQLQAVVDCRGVNVVQTLRLRPVLGRLAGTLNEMYPMRLHALYLVGLPAPLRWLMRLMLRVMHPDTRRKVKLVAPGKAPRRLPGLTTTHDPRMPPGVSGQQLARTATWTDEEGVSHSRQQLWAPPLQQGRRLGAGGAGGQQGSHVMMGLLSSLVLLLLYALAVYYSRLPEPAMLLAYLQLFGILGRG